MGLSLAALLPLKRSWLGLATHYLDQVSRLQDGAWLIFFVGILISSAGLCHWLSSRNVVTRWCNNLSCKPSFYSAWDHCLAFIIGFACGFADFQPCEIDLAIFAVAILIPVVVACSYLVLRPARNMSNAATVQPRALPISSFASDELDRRHLVLHLRRLIRGRWQGADLRGSIIGLEGELGAGKTSVLNLLCNSLRRLHNKLIIVRIDPWAVRGAKSTQRFLIGEINNALNRSYNSGELESVLGNYLTHIESGWPKAGLMGRLLGVKKGGLPEEKESLERAISRIDRYILVVLDDVERLLGAEMYSLLRLIDNLRTIPNCVFLLSYDPAIVTPKFNKAMNDEK